jgi:hypothetical protein
MFMSPYMSWWNYVFVKSVIYPATFSSLDVFQQHLLFHTCPSLVHCISTYSISKHMLQNSALLGIKRDRYHPMHTMQKAVFSGMPTGFALSYTVINCTE